MYKDSYGEAVYADLRCRVAESVFVPLGWDRNRIERHLRDTRDAAVIVRLIDGE